MTAQPPPRDASTPHPMFFAKGSRRSCSCLHVLCPRLDCSGRLSVVSSDVMDRYGADNLKDALRLATRITVEAWETNRTKFQARGFEIKNTQIDGVGLPNNRGIVTGAMD